MAPEDPGQNLKPTTPSEGHVTQKILIAKESSEKFINVMAVLTVRWVPQAQIQLLHQCKIQLLWLVEHRDGGSYSKSKEVDGKDPLAQEETLGFCPDTRSQFRKQINSILRDFWASKLSCASYCNQKN